MFADPGAETTPFLYRIRCRHWNGNFAKSKRIFKNQNRYCSKGIFQGIKANGEKFNREWLVYSPSTGYVFVLSIQAEKEYWKQVLHRCIEVIKTLSERGLAFRGDNEIIGSPNNGNYLGLLELIAKFDLFLSNHIENYGNKGTDSTSYLSKTICDELILLMGKHVLQSILDEIKNSWEAHATAVSAVKENGESIEEALAHLESKEREKSDTR
ncbi:uncharacterized protein LOC119578782 [Penaeus monodon]|uniref:uncharacterized protein LOC119578782 n=1 Tax=Penaeus monodon TaxID=6687 RepID=UPI0018A7435B|nr:uncharacterized protein LOC119578782 [Penaeus monodon]